MLQKSDYCTINKHDQQLICKVVEKVSTDYYLVSILLNGYKFETYDFKFEYDFVKEEELKKLSPIDIPEHVFKWGCSPSASPISEVRPYEDGFIILYSDGMYVNYVRVNDSHYGRWWKSEPRITIWNMYELGLITKDVYDELAKMYYSIRESEIKISNQLTAIHVMDDEGIPVNPSWRTDVYEKYKHNRDLSLKLSNFK